MQHPEDTIVRQYYGSPKLSALLADVNAWIDPSVNLATFNAYVWDLNSAQGFGLDILGRILGLRRYLGTVTTQDYFGMLTNVTDTPDYIIQNPFSTYPFFNNAQIVGLQIMPDNVYRQVLIAKALANLTAPTSGGINSVLRVLFAGRGRAYVYDPLDMSFVYVGLEFQPTPFETALMQTSVIPRPAGVGVSVRVILGPHFGFNTPNEANYTQFGSYPVQPNDNAAPFYNGSGS